VAGFYSDIASGTAPLTVQFTDLSSGGPISWSWSFGDGGTDTVQNPSHTYANSGTYTVTLTATNPEGATYTQTRSDYITVDTPVTVTETITTETTSIAVQNTISAGFTGTPVTGASPLEVSFTDTSTGSPSSWNWDFGDGSQSTLENPSHIYSVPDSYTVSLTVTGSGGTNVKSLTDYITVKDESTPVTTQTSVTQIRKENTGALQKSTTSPTISRQPTAVTTPGEQPDQTGIFGYIMIFVIISVIVVVAAILYLRTRDRDELM